MSKKVAVIGSGFGGLGIALRLQAQGYEVSLFEKNEMVGGHGSQIKDKGYTFDMGPSLITAPKIIEDLFAVAGEKVEEHLELHYLDPFYRVYFHDKTYIDYNGNEEQMMAQISKFNKDDAKAYPKFLEFSKEIYKAVIEDGLGSTPFNKLSVMLNFLPQAIKTKALYPGYYLASKYFKDYRTRFMFSFHPLFIGGNPFRVPSIYLMISYLEKAGGVWYSTGGMYSLVTAIKNIFEKNGGKVFLNSPVEEIIIENNTAKGVKVNGQKHNFDLVISNADVTHTHKDLLKDVNLKTWNVNKLKKAKHSMSSFVLYLGTKKKYPELLHHTLILSERYKELVKDIFDNHTLPDDFSMYLHVPSKTDPSMAPEGCESMYVLAPVTNLASGIDWKIEGPKFADKIIDYLENEFGMEGLRENIDYMSYYSPLEFAEKRNSYLGSPWGLEPYLLQTAYFRPHNKNSDISNLYYVGAGTHPGAGVPGVLLSAEATEKLVKEEHPLK